MEVRFATDPVNELPPFTNNSGNSATHIGTLVWTALIAVRVFGTV
jgi:hypothetical protein